MDIENISIEKVVENYTKLQDQMSTLSEILLDVNNCTHESTKKLILITAMKLSENLGFKDKIFG